MKSDFIALAGAIAIGLSLLQAKAQDWPGLLGPSANGASSEIGLLDIWPTNGPQISWSKKIGTGYGAPSIRRANVIVQHRIGDEEIVESFKQNSGESIWRYRYPSAFVDPYGYNN